MSKNTSGRIPRLRDVAEVVGVSHQTVSRVLNGHPNVSELTRERVESAMLQMGYRRNSVARSLVTRRSRTIGVLASQLAEYGPARTLFGVEQAARNAGYFVSFAALGEVTKGGILSAVDHLLGQAVEGIVVLAHHHEIVEAFDEMTLPVPVVAVGSAGSSKISGVMVDQRYGAHLAVRHLLELGHTRIAHVRGPANGTDSGERSAGWRETLQDAGLTCLLDLEGDWSARSGYDIGRELVSSKHVSGIFVGNDQMALGVLRAFAEANVRVPEDVSIVGFDDQPESAYFTPPLSTVRQDFEELGRKCVDVMLRKIADEPEASALVLPPTLIVRGSTAPPRD